MIKKVYGVIIFIAVFIFTAVFSVPVYANSAAPPSLSIVVLNAPDDIEIYSADSKEKASSAALTSYQNCKAILRGYKEFSLAEPLFRFYEGHSFPSTIEIKADGRKTFLELPVKNISGYDKYAVLD